MGSDDSVNSSGSERLNEIIAEYLRAAEVGEAPDRRELLDRYPDLEGELAAFLADHDKIEELAKPAESVGEAKGESPGLDAPTLPPGQGKRGRPQRRLRPRPAAECSNAASLSGGSDRSTELARLSNRSP
ncbi:MAG: hypothetical protein H8E44_08390 [Planctomycetes bacterium]|nr:hypothetical protein [Planctomycetota bacterium]MBL7041515.1 hypothetical protein [Pirellulaceae bacterium]